VEADESLLEISTDKVDTEVPSPGSGVVQQILVQEGETVEVGTKLAVIAPEGAEPAPAAAEAPSSSEGETPTPETAPPPAPPAPAPVAADGNGGGEKTFISPVVARIASEHGVDVNQVSGTGRGGRVTKKDILGSSSPAERPRSPSLRPPRRPRSPSRLPPRRRLQPRRPQPRHRRLRRSRRPSRARATSR